MIHTCTRCELRFSTDSELKGHLRDDHDVEVALVPEYHAAHEAKPLYTDAEPNEADPR